MHRSGTFSWNIETIAQSLYLTEEEVHQYFTDGRRVSFLLERRFAREVIGGNLAQSEGAGYDLIDLNGDKWEVRSISSDGIYFCPSYMVGSGRKFVETGFLRKVADVRGYLISDITRFPEVPWWEVPATVILDWWNSRRLGTTTKISRQKALSLLSTLL
jgi:hypothetical protein